MAQNEGHDISPRDMCIQFISPQPQLDVHPDDGPLPEPVQQTVEPDVIKNTTLSIVSLNQASITGSAPHNVGLALPRYWFWRPGRTLRVFFMDGTDALKSEVMRYASEWQALCNLKFTRVEDNEAEIRISLADDQGYNSSVGTSCYDVDKDLPTMRLSISHNTPVWRRHYVLHEFGHAIGCIHEHSSPAAHIEWNVPAVKAYFGGPPNRWSVDKIYRNVLHQYTTDEVVNTTLDLSSIMAYQIPKELTLNNFSMPLNMTLSNVDKDFISKMYGWNRRDTATLRTMDMPDRQPFQQSNIKKVDFYPPYQGVEPRIAVALNWIDCSAQHGQRIRAFEDKVTTVGMEFHVDAWADTVLWGGAASWMEFDRIEHRLQTGTFFSYDVRPWNHPAHPANDTKTITFGNAFRNVPNVVLFIRYVDIDGNTGTRLKVWTENVTKTTFDVHIGTWADTTLWTGGVSWVAYDPQNLPEDVWVESGTLSELTYPVSQLHHQGSINFTTNKFAKPPSVLFGFNYFDFNNERGTRLSGEYANVTKNKMDWVVNSWSDSICYGIGASWLAIGAKA